jgi:hypothetical protein
MEELFNLTYKDEVEELKDEENFEELGDAKYIEHEDFEARLYWAFCRPSGSHAKQIQDSHPLVSIMAFNHSRLGALERFRLLHKEVIEKDSLRVKIKNRSRMLFRDLVDNDFKELNEVLNLVPVYLPVAIDQLKNGRKWNDIAADDLEATKFLALVGETNDDKFYKAFYLKLTNFEDFELGEVKKFLDEKIAQKDNLHQKIKEYYKKQTKLWIEQNDIHILQQKSLEVLLKKL